MNDPRPITEGLALARRSLGAPKPAVVGDKAREVMGNDATREVEEAMRLNALLRWEASIPRRFRSALVADFASTVARPLDGWRDDPTRNLVILGDVGVGKTHAAVAAARRVVEGGAECSFWPADDLLEAMKPGGDPGLLDRSAEVDLLILDDLGLHYDTAWSASRLAMILNRRWMAEIPTVATSNLAPADLEQAIGARAYSRLAHDAVVLSITGSDRRRS